MVDELNCKYVVIMLAEGAYEWTVGSFFDKVKSPEFTISGMDEYRWQMVLQRDTLPTTQLTLRLVRKPAARQKVFTRFEFRLNGKYVGKWKAILDQTLEVGIEFSASGIFKPRADGTRLVTAYIQFDYGMDSGISLQSIDALGEDLTALFKSKELSDFTIILKNNEKVPVHKNIVAARSPYIKRKTDKDENLQDLTIQNVAPEIMKELISFIYSGSIIHSEVESTKDLFVAAKAFEMTDLQNSCSDYLTTNVTTDNVKDLYTFSKKHDLEHLTQSCVKLFYNDSISPEVKFRKFVENNGKLLKAVEEFRRTAEVRMFDPATRCSE